MIVNLSRRKSLAGGRALRTQGSSGSRRTSNFLELPGNLGNTKESLSRSADVLSGRHIVRCFLDILSGPSSDILSGLLGSAPDVLSGRLRIRHIVRRTFCQDWMDLHQTNCQDVYVDQSIFLVYWPYFWYVYDQISQFRPNFTISTKMAQK